MAQEITPIQEVQGTLAKMGDQFRMSLPAHIKAEKFIRAAQTAIQNNPDLLILSRPTLYNSLMKCAQDGLLPDGREAVITKKGGDAVYMPMIGGILKLIRNSGELLTVDAEVVHEKDEYDAWTDERGPHFKFKRAKGDRGPVVSTFAYAITKDGGVYFEDVSNEEMAAIQKSASTQFVWNGGFREEMMKKSALRRMAKRMPKSTDIEEVFKNDDDAFDIEKPKEEVKPETTSSNLSDAIVGSTRPGVADATVVEPVKPVQQPTPEPVAATETTVPSTGLFLSAVLFEKTSNKKCANGSTKYGGKIGEKWFGTFSKTVFDLMEYSIKNRAAMNMTYEEKVIGEKTFNEILKLEQATVDSVIKNDDLPY